MRPFVFDKPRSIIVEIYIYRVDIDLIVSCPFAFVMSCGRPKRPIRSDRFSVGLGFLVFIPFGNVLRATCLVTRNKLLVATQSVPQFALFKFAFNLKIYNFFLKFSYRKV